MRFAPLLSVLVVAALAIAAPGLRADDGGERSASAHLVVSATVVSSCSVASANGQVTLRCARGGADNVRVGNRIVTSAESHNAAVARTTTTGTLITIDF